MKNITRISAAAFYTRTMIVAGIAFASLGTVAAGCVGEGAEPGQEGTTPPEQVGVASQALSSPYCETAADCAERCVCENHQCAVPTDGFSPPPNCTQPPVQVCNSSSDCRTGCTCLAETCQYQGFSPPRLDCNLPPKAIVPISGTWVDASRPGTYFNVSNVSNGDVVVYWYTFLSSGSPVWYYAVLAAPSGSYTFTGQLISARLVNGTSQPSAVGSLALSTSSVGTGELTWAFTNGSGSGKAAINYAIRAPGSGSAANLTGDWYAPTQSGWGESFDTQGTTQLAELAVYDASGNPIWLEGSTSWSPFLQSYTVALEEYKGLGLCPSCTGSQSLTGQAMGSMQIGSISQSPCKALLTVNLSAPLSQWNRTSLPISCLSE